ncbi:MAG: ornithine carbamoyltransferase [Pirellulaceae bacterium]
MKHVLSLFDLTTDEILAVLKKSSEMKMALEAGERPTLLKGMNLAMLFQKQSLRTRVSFEAGMVQLGGNAMYLGADVGWGKRESVKDFSEVLSQYVDFIAVRAKEHQDVVDLAEFATCPVINALTDYSHPCQALADVLTIQEAYSDVSGKHLVYVGDANNVARSLSIIALKLDMKITIVCPDAYHFTADEIREIQAGCGVDGEIVQTSQIAEGVATADAIYTDVWASMGQESEQAIRAEAFAKYQVNEQLMESAPDSAIFLHCLPARRGQEVSDGVMDGPQSYVVQQAGNRMHAQKGLLVWLSEQS